MKREWYWRWLVTKSGGRLHRVVGGRKTETAPFGIRNGTTLCGLAGDFYMPGVLSRMYQPRCSHCCRAVGIPLGSGAPYNEFSDNRRNA